MVDNLIFAAICYIISVVIKMENIYKREDYLKKIRGFYNDSSMIKVITGIRRCGKSFLLKSIINELKENGIKEKDIIYIELDSREYKDITTPVELENIIDGFLDNDFKYIFIDEVQNVQNYEKIINSFREETNYSIFLTGSNSYLLSGELATKLTGRYIEIEVLPLNFYEYIDMKKFLGKKVNNNIYNEFEEYIRDGGFPGSLYYDNHDDKLLYTKNVINQIFEKDIRKHKKIQDKELFEIIENYIVNNFGAIISIGNIYKYITESLKIRIDRRTIKNYVKLLENAKILYPCDLFDMKSKIVLDGDKKYYLADLSIYYALNTYNRINYGPVLENILFLYLKSHNYNLSVGKIGNLECDFIARRGIDEYFYLQVAKNIQNEKTAEREYRPFYEIKELYPRYLFLTDLILQKNVDGIKNVNIVDFISNNEEL